MKPPNNFIEGDVGIGTTGAPALKLHVHDNIEGNIFRLEDNDGTCNYDPDSGAVVVSCSSDRRLKSNIVNTGNALAYLEDLRVRDYTVNASGNTTTGLIAQEALQTHPELVTMGDDGYYQVSEISSWTLVKAIQQLDTKTTNLGSLTQAIENNTAKNNIQQAAIASNTQAIKDLKNQFDTLDLSQLNTVNAKAITTDGLTVMGVATVETLVVETATITGDLVVEGSASVGNLVVSGHIVTQGDELELEVMPKAGLDAEAEIDGNDVSGTITFTTGTEDLETGAVLGITFVEEYENAPRIVLSPVNAEAALASVFVNQADVTTEGFSLTALKVLEDETEYQFNYIIIEGNENEPQL